jgi:DNA helicase-2/ATP-dependent DNA helicase PcrA
VNAFLHDSDGIFDPDRSLDDNAPWEALDKYIANLNPSQRDAVSSIDGPVLVLAGAGTGKTAALTARLCNIVRKGVCPPWNILAVTFTNKAAAEMKKRVANLGGDVLMDSIQWVGTFHAVNARILRRHCAAVGLQSDFTILDVDDQIRLAKKIIREAGIDEKRWSARFFTLLLDRWKNKALLCDQVPEKESHRFADGAGVALYKRYQEELRMLNACDFGDLILHVLTILRNDADILAQYQDTFQYILVDEYQDTNVAQYLWLRLLSQKHKNICCVGDDDQSIYGWRGAEVNNILNFEKDFVGAKIIHMEQNYRSTPHILSGASGLIAMNAKRYGKTLWTRLPTGLPIISARLHDSNSEARWIAEQILKREKGLLSHGESFTLDDCAVLVRASFQMRAFEDCFLSLGLRYRVIGGPRFYERAEIRDAIAYLRLINNTNDGLALERIINTPRRGLGGKTLAILHQTAREKGVSLYASISLCVDQKIVSSRAATSLGQLIQQFEKWQNASDLSLAELAKIVIDESGYIDMWRNETSPDAPGRVDNLKEFVRSLVEFSDLPEFLEHVSLVMDNVQNDSKDKINIMTLHAAKGLEFDTVFLSGWEEGVFPSQRSMEESGERGLEEERRLAYVGMTRARRCLVITSAANRWMYNHWQSSVTSRFLGEIPFENMQIIDQTARYGYNSARSLYKG